MPRGPRFGFDRIREFARARVEATSLREVASDIGMSYSGLHSFLQGREPYARTRKKLLDWYARSRDTARPAPTRDEAQSAITILADYLQSGGRLKVSESDVRTVVTRLRRAVRRSDDVQE